MIERELAGIDGSFSSQSPSGVELQRHWSVRRAGNSAAWRDLAGVTASVACAIHCAAMPMIVGFLPALGLSFLADESFHQWMAVVCFVLALAAFVPGFRRHRRWLPASVAAVGLFAITFNAFTCECCSADSLRAPEASTGLANTPLRDVTECTEACCQTPAASDDPASKPADSLVATPTPLKAAMVSIGSAEFNWWQILGGMTLVTGHLLNRRLLRRCDCCVGVSPDDSQPDA